MANQNKNKLTPYPWDRWFRRKQFRLVKGKDFDCMTHCMSVQVRAAAIKRGLRVSVYISTARYSEPELIVVRR